MFRVASALALHDEKRKAQNGSCVSAERCCTESAAYFSNRFLPDASPSSQPNEEGRLVRTARTFAALAERLTTGVAVLAGVSAGAGPLLWGILWWPPSGHLSSLLGAAATLALLMGPAVVLSGPLLSGPPRPFGPSRPAVRSDDAYRRTIHRHAPISNDGDAVGPPQAPMGHREAHLGPPWRSVGEPGTARPVRGAPSACNTGLPVPRRESHRRHRPVRAGCLPRPPSCPDPVGGPHRSAPSVTGAGRRVYQGPTPRFPTPSVHRFPQSSRVLAAILLPTLSIFLQEGTGVQFWGNVLLTLLGLRPRARRLDCRPSVEAAQCSGSGPPTTRRCPLRLIEPPGST